MRTLERLNGWQRLWLLISVLYGIAVAATTAYVIPTRSELMADWAQDVLRALQKDYQNDSGNYVPIEQWRNRFLGKSDEQIVRETTEGAKKIDIRNPKQADLGPYRDEILRLERVYEFKLDDLPSRQTR